MNTSPYYKFSTFLKETYNEKVYKIPINVPCSCPNRDGFKSTEGCIFCSDIGAGFETQEDYIPIAQQLQTNIDYIGKKYKAKKFIAYFQNYSNTYVPLNVLEKRIMQCLRDDVVAIYISTRPDCINEEQCLLFDKIQKENNVDIVIEMGLQTCNDRVLKILNRQHTFKDFVNSAILLKKYNVKRCVHMISDLPFESIDDVIDSARKLNELGIEQVKNHSLYILKNTKLANMYKNNEVNPISLEEYIERTITFLEHLNEKIVIQRLIGRAPKEDTIFCNYGRSWRYIVDRIEKEMIESNRLQGIKLK